MKYMVLYEIEDDGCLDVSDKGLTSLSKLPDGIRMFFCYNNKLKYLPELPESLVFLYCSDNPLECLIPMKFVKHQSNNWLENYYIPYINSYEGQKNILNSEPWMAGELMEQVKILDSIIEEFGGLFISNELNLL